MHSHPVVWNNEVAAVFDTVYGKAGRKAVTKIRA
jgi:hypothetical protein